ncbi:MAG: NmrA family NAD(P)-binding protein [Actinobacteria bacterium]|nr:NmrA family NAD(P)-binding protein [Actinomycetota bacterium]
MDTRTKPVYVVGAAGHQGGAAMRHLQALGVEAHALFDERDARRRDQRWSEPGARIARFDEPDALERALRGVGALVLVLEDPETGPAERLRHGRVLIDAAVAAGVGQIVFAAATGPDHHRLSCDVSAETERYLRRLDVPATVLRPATIMEEVPWYWLARYGRQITLATPFVADAHLPLVALDDVGALAALAASRPGEFAGRSIDLAGDTETPLQIAARLTEALGQPVEYEEVQVEGVFVYQEASTQVHDIEWLRGVYPRLHTFSSWLEDGGLALCRRHLGMTSPDEVREVA